MLKLLFPSQIALGLAQAGIAALMALAVVLLARRRNIHLESDAAVALLRGIVQIVAVGSYLALLLKAPRWTSVFLLTGMVLAAGSISAKRAKNIPGAAKISTYSIAVGAGLVTAIMTWAGVIDTAITSLIPVGSMIIANAMNTNGLALNRFRSEVLAHAGEIETALAWSRTRSHGGRYAESSIHSSLIPAIDNLRSLGIVWIPGLMPGSDPCRAHHRSRPFPCAVQFRGTATSRRRAGGRRQSHRSHCGPWVWLEHRRFRGR